MAFGDLTTRTANLRLNTSLQKQTPLGLIARTTLATMGSTYIPIRNNAEPEQLGQNTAENGHLKMLS